jgi:hypothetical protein
MIFQLDGTQVLIIYLYWAVVIATFCYYIDQKIRLKKPADRSLRIVSLLLLLVYVVLQFQFDW